MPWNKVTNIKGPNGQTGPSPSRYAKRIATTGATGIVDIVFPVNLFSTIPSVSADVECPTADVANFSYRCEFLGAPTATGCKVRVTRQPTTLVIGLLGAVITTINAAPAGVFVNILATEQTT